MTIGLEHQNKKDNSLEDEENLLEETETIVENDVADFDFFDEPLDNQMYQLYVDSIKIDSAELVLKELKSDGLSFPNASLDSVQTRLIIMNSTDSMMLSTIKDSLQTKLDALKIKTIQISE